MTKVKSLPELIKILPDAIIASIALATNSALINRDIANFKNLNGLILIRCKQQHKKPN